ncbi:hypothetical protein [Acetobacter lambici]|uniref:hypothetical protein n=1 Tax=Acetobacter lambici TaxID=1332824 RepID=UPI0020A30DE4|nr:hypothetical protein [Acetobacter lambici]MCP1243316.1 hypothetical protein [Acetobacter lambici]
MAALFQPRFVVSLAPGFPYMLRRTLLGAACRAGPGLLIGQAGVGMVLCMDEYT